MTTEDKELNQEQEGIDPEVELEGEEGADYTGVEPDKAKEKEYTKKADQIWLQAQSLGLPATHPVLRDIFDHLTSGRAKRAEAKLNKLQAAVTDEKVQERLEEKGISTGGEKTEASISKDRLEDIKLRYGLNPESLSRAELEQLLRHRQEGGRAF